MKSPYGCTDKKEMDNIFGTTILGDFIHLFVVEVHQNRYRGFIKLNVHFGKKNVVVWFFRKFDFYLVGIHYGYNLYEQRKLGTRNRWLYNARMMGYRENYSSLAYNMR